MQIASWNVNSLTVRLPHVLDWLRANPVDVLGLQELKGSGVLPAGHHAARFLKGGHSSLLAPDENFDQAGAVTTEIQTQFASFFMSGGAAVKVTDDTLIKQ